VAFDTKTCIDPSTQLWLATKSFANTTTAAVAAVAAAAAADMRYHIPMVRWEMRAQARMLHICHFPMLPIRLVVKLKCNCMLYSMWNLLLHHQKEQPVRCFHHYLHLHLQRKIIIELQAVQLLQLPKLQSMSSKTLKLPKFSSVECIDNSSSRMMESSNSCD
jgi:hypothetical protein